MALMASTAQSKRMMLCQQALQVEIKCAFRNRQLHNTLPDVTPLFAMNEVPGFTLRNVEFFSL